MSNQYLVTWQMDQEDRESPEAAARAALADILRPGSIAHVFEVTDIRTNQTVTIDLNEVDGNPNC